MRPCDGLSWRKSRLSIKKNLHQRQLRLKIDNSESTLYPSSLLWHMKRKVGKPRLRILGQSCHHASGPAYDDQKIQVIPVLDLQGRRLCWLTLALSDARPDHNIIMACHIAMCGWWYKYCNTSRIPSDSNEDKLRWHTCWMSLAGGWSAPFEAVPNLWGIYIFILLVICQLKCVCTYHKVLGLRYQHFLSFFCLTMLLLIYVPVMIMSADWWVKSVNHKWSWSISS